MKQRTLDINPDTVLLRATWMYDMLKYGVLNRGNSLVNQIRNKPVELLFDQDIVCISVA